jgi:peroxiredoxin Q/BCP
MEFRLNAGDRAPDFALPATNGGTVGLADFAGKGLVVYFFPKAMTPACTTQACDFRDNRSGFDSADYAVLGISPDPLQKLEEFSAAHRLTFPLASDTDMSTAARWGAVGEKVKDGRTATGLLRSTVVVSPQGTVELAQYRVDAEGHVDRLRADLGLSART